MMHQTSLNVNRKRYNIWALFNSLTKIFNIIAYLKTGYNNIKRIIKLLSQTSKNCQL